MLDDFDLFGTTGTEGTRWMRIVSGAIGVIIGGILGYFYASIEDVTTLVTVAYAGTGALIGGFFGAVFSFYVFVGLAIVIVVGGVLAYEIMKAS